MPKIKVKRKSTFIDMTAMSDVTVLLLTFFMLTSTFVQKEPVQVATPASVSEIKIPETNILQILVDPKGKIFMSLDNQDNRVDVLQNVGREYGIEFTPEEINKFKLMNSFGSSSCPDEVFFSSSDGQAGRYLERLRDSYRYDGQSF